MGKWKNGKLKQQEKKTVVRGSSRVQHWCGTKDQGLLPMEVGCSTAFLGLRGVLSWNICKLKYHTFSWKAQFNVEAHTKRCLFSSGEVYWKNCYHRNVWPRQKKQEILLSEFEQVAPVVRDRMNVLHYTFPVKGQHPAKNASDWTEYSKPCL